MNSLLKNVLYQEDLKKTAQLDLPWNKLKNSSILITGATGMLGSFLIDVLMFKNSRDSLNCHVYAVGRNIKKAQVRFEGYFDNNDFSFITCDINEQDFVSKLPETVDYVFHAASNTHPVAYANDPIGTITSNIFASYYLLNYCANNSCKRFILASSNEIYGENRGDTEFFSEDYCGYINSNTLRAGYPESKRCCEALCQAFIKQDGVDAVIVRFTRSYGPTLLPSDTKALSQFLNNGINDENIVLKSDGLQYFSYTYVADAISGLLTVILRGDCGEAYNIAHASCDITLKELAQLIASKAGTKVIFDIPSETEKAGFSTATKARLDGSKISQLGWVPQFSLDNGISRTLDILKEIRK